MILSCYRMNTRSSIRNGTKNVTFEVSRDKGTYMMFKEETNLILQGMFS